MFRDKLIAALVVFLLCGPAFYVLGYLTISFIFWEWVSVSYYLVRLLFVTGLSMSVFFWFSTDENGK